jgi:hypothetical protein
MLARLHSAASAVADDGRPCAALQVILKPFPAARCSTGQSLPLQGAFMEKCLTMRAGQTPVQKYWHKLLAMIQVGQRWRVAATCKQTGGRKAAGTCVSPLDGHAQRALH